MGLDTINTDYRLEFVLKITLVGYGKVSHMISVFNAFADL